MILFRTDAIGILFLVSMSFLIDAPGCTCAAEVKYSEGMEYPLAVAASSDGTIFVADRNLPGIWKVKDGKATIYFQGSKKFRTPLNAVRCLAVDSKGTLYAGDSATRDVYRFDANDQPQPITKGGIGIPTAIGSSSTGSLFVADLEKHMVFQIDLSSGTVTEFVKIQAPRGIALDREDRVWIVSHSPTPLIRVGKDKKSEVIVSEPTFQFAHHLVLDSNGVGYLCDGYAKTIWKIPESGKPEKFFSGEPLMNPVGIGLDQKRLLIADPHQKKVFSLPLAGDKVLQSIVQ